MKEKISLLKYNHSDNIGDNIQTLVSKSILEQLNFEVEYLNQEDLNKDNKFKKKFFVNGFFCFNDYGHIFPFNENIQPFFSNLHIELDYNKEQILEKKFFSKKKNLEYFKKFEPIGCRDEESKNILKKYGIKAKNNECITFLLERRSKEEEENAKKIIFVDIDEFVPVPKKMKKNSEYMTHFLSSAQIYDNEDKLNISKKILNYYKKNAKIIITSKFHCAVPCIAMGIPVIFFGDPNSTRLAPLKKYIKIHPYVNLGLRNRSQFRTTKILNKIPILNKKIHYAFTLSDYIYTVFYKIYLTTWYKLRLLKVDLKPKSLNIENEKDKKVQEILKLLNLDNIEPSSIRGKIE